MKVDLKGVGLMIHFRRDIDDRFRNLKMVVDFYRKNSNNLEIVIVNDDSELDKDIKQFCDDYSCEGLFMENLDIYWRTKAFNEAAKKLRHVDCLIAGDTDVIVDPKFILEAKEIFEKNEKVGIVYPYNGMFVHLKQPMFEIFAKDQAILDLLEKSQTLIPIPYHQDENFLVAHPQSKGGMVMFKKDAYFDTNGYNPNFRGWGFEDDEILARFQKFGWEVTRVQDKDAIAWHLPHENTVREKHPYYGNNKLHSDFVCENQDIDKLKEYVKNWDI